MSASFFQRRAVLLVAAPFSAKRLCTHWPPLPPAPPTLNNAPLAAVPSVVAEVTVIKAPLGTSVPSSGAVMVCNPVEVESATRLATKSALPVPGSLTTAVTLTVAVLLSLIPAAVLTVSVTVYVPSEP